MSATPRDWARAILLPPMTFHRTGDARAFWTAAALTAAGYVPGVGYALYHVARRRG